MIKFGGRTSGLDIVTEQPNELVLLEFRSRKAMLVIVPSLRLLCIFQLSTKFFVDLNEPFCKIVSSWDCRTFRDLWFKGGVKSEVSKKWGLTSGSILQIVECELREWEVINPIILLVQAVCTEVRLKRLVGTLGQSICLRMISCRSSSVNVQTRSESLPEIRNKY